MKNNNNKFIRSLKIVFFVLFSSIASFGQESDSDKENTEINDCPYVFYIDDTVVVKWVENSFIREKVFSVDDFKTFKTNNCNEFKANRLKINPVTIVDDEQKYEGVSKIAVLSDIHGQYDLLTDLLRANKIINEKDEWIYGKGHFVIVGDIFDRGDKVTETLWFIYNLEQQAAEAGGKVHYLLGNHEIMVLAGYEKYVNEKYKWVSKGMGITHKELFGNQTLLGEWIRTKPIAISINDIAFAHAGFSPEFTEGNYSIKEVNELFHKNIIDQEKEIVLEDEDLKFLVKKNGPIWYRGYFRDENFSKEKAQDILDDMGMKHIVVGHTSMEEVTSHYDGLIYSVDSSMKKGENAEILIWEDNTFFKSTLTGLKTPL